MGINQKIPETLKIHVNCHLIYIPQKDVKKPSFLASFDVLSIKSCPHTVLII